MTNDQHTPGVIEPSVGDSKLEPALECARLALLGNPNTGKTTIFNRLSGLRHRTSNFPGTTQEARIGHIVSEDDRTIELIDLPGVYSLELLQSEADICRAVLSGELAPKGEALAKPDALCVIVDATNLARGLTLVGEAVRRRLPMVVAVNMIDIARRSDVHIDCAKLAQRLGCPVVACSARTGEGLEALRAALASPLIPIASPPEDEDGVARWAAEVHKSVTWGSDPGDDSFTDVFDRVATHPVLGLALFTAVMAGLFWAVFAIATYPMGWIETLFVHVGGAVEAVVPAGILQDFLSNGVVAGIAGVLVFLPQICLLFFLISILEDTGYLARAAFVMDRLLRPFGLPGHSFVPLLSSHACALPGIMAARAVPDRRERLATILVAPFMTCSARLPVYVLATSLLFPNEPGLAALAFVGAYALGIVAGVLSALLARRTILRGPSRPMALELPTYKRPTIGTALLTTWDGGLVFVRNAGTSILAICIVLWWLGAYPRVAPPPEVEALRTQASAMVETAPDDAAAMLEQADRMEASHAQRRSFMGRIGETVQPVFAPLGFDSQLTVGILASFAAREVFVSTMAIVTTGCDDAEDEGIIQQIRTSTRADGQTPVFTRATTWALLVYYVLAMQCLPTLAVTAREAGGWKWALLQQAWMTGVAYGAALIVFQSLRAMGVA